MSIEVRPVPFLIIGTAQMNRMEGISRPANAGTGEEERPGAAWAFTRTGSEWVQQGSELTGSGESGSGYFGASVALSSDGSTALVGGPGDDGEVGAVWVFGYSPPSVEGIIPDAGLDAGGTTVNVAGTELGGAVAVDFGTTPAASFVVNSQTSITAVAPSGSGTVNITVTTPLGSSATDPADEFSYVASGPGPTIKKLSTKKGPAAGGTRVTISGSGFVGVTAVTFGSTNAASYELHSATSITAVTPAGATGTVEVRVTPPTARAA